MWVVVMSAVAGKAELPLLAAVIRHYDELRAFIIRKIECPALASDILQEVCEKAAHGSSDTEIVNPRAYLYRVAANLAVDKIRQQATRELPADIGTLNSIDPMPDAERSLAAKQRLTLLRKIVDELPPKCRTVFVMRRFDDVPQDEIARRLGISRNMVEKHLRHALDHCARRLAELDH